MTVASGRGAYVGMAGCLVSAFLVSVTLGLGQLADRSLEQVLGAYADDHSEFCPPDFCDAEDLATEIEEHPRGSREVYPTGRLSVAGTGVYLPGAELVVQGDIWEKGEEFGDARLDRCRSFMPVPGSLQTVQRPEFWGAILALQTFWPGHLGIHNLDFVRSIAR